MKHVPEQPPRRLTEERLPQRTHSWFFQARYKCISTSFHVNYYMWGAGKRCHAHQNKQLAACIRRGSQIHPDAERKGSKFCAMPLFFSLEWRGRWENDPAGWLPCACYSTLSTLCWFRRRRPRKSERVRRVPESAFAAANSSLTREQKCILLEIMCYD